MLTLLSWAVLLLAGDGKPSLLQIEATALGKAMPCVWLTRPMPPVSLDTFRRIRAGMTLQEVKDILGDPDDTLYGFGWDGMWQEWRSGCIAIAVDYGGDSPRVVRGQFWKKAERCQGLPDR